MNTLQRQRGLSTLGWLVAISLFGFSVLTASKLLPHYMDNRFVVEALKTLADDPEFPRMTASEVRSKLGKTFTINNIRGKPTQSVKVTKNSKGTLVNISYEERIEFLHNIDVVLTFDHLLDSNAPDECCRPPQD